MNLIVTYLKSNYKIILTVLSVILLYIYISALNAKIDSLKEELNISQQKSELFFSQLVAERQRCNQQVEDDIKKSELLKLQEENKTLLDNIKLIEDLKNKSEIDKLKIKGQFDKLKDKKCLSEKIDQETAEIIQELIK
jgi:hypothetical protein